MFHFVEGDHLVAKQKAAQFIGAVGEWPHNVIVPTGTIPPVRNYNKSARTLHDPQKSPDATRTTGKQFSRFEIPDAAKADYEIEATT
jgi:hypothetical protein